MKAFRIRCGARVIYALAPSSLAAWVLVFDAAGEPPRSVMCLQRSVR